MNRHDFRGFKLLGLAPAVILWAACGAPGNAELSGFDTAEQALVTQLDGMYFYAPLGSGGGTGTFDATLASRLHVALDASSSTEATDTVVTFDARSTPAVVLLADRQLYGVDVPAARWITDATRTYRVRVMLDSLELGRADVPSAIFSYIASNPSMTLGVRFRVEVRTWPTSEPPPPTTEPPPTTQPPPTTEPPPPTTEPPPTTTTTPPVSTGSCGDGVCGAGELQATCSIDCTTPPPAGPSGTCGNGVCDPYSESPASCAADCPWGASTSVCARNGKLRDGNCEAARGESSANCPEDCAPYLVSGTPVTSLPELGHGTYKGFVGGLYPDGENTMPADHLAAGRARAAELVPLDRQGLYDPVNGKIVMISVGMSNTTQEFCHHEGIQNNTADRCQSWTFMGRARDDSAVNHSTLAIVNGARGGMSIDYWMTPFTAHIVPNCLPYSSPTALPANSLELGANRVFDDEWDRVNACNLTSHGYDYRQVQVAWVKLARTPTNNAGILPYANAEAYYLKRDLGNVMRTLRTRYPNLKMVFLSSRVYGGFAGANQAEPYAYESGFAVKWLIETQINQMRHGGVVVESTSSPSYAGDLRYPDVAPWIGWGPYLWANGTNTTAVGTSWPRSSFYPAYDSDYGQADGTHLNREGETAVGALMLDFFKTSPLTSCWFLAGGTCAP